MERKMATIRKIDNILPIEGADLIHAVKIGGWTVVAQKSMGYKINDLVVYCEIDSFIPTDIAPFLTPEGKEPKEYNGIKGERQSFCKETFLTHVPVLDSCLVFNDESVEDVLKFAEAKSVVGSFPEREGLVFKRLTTDDSFKAISNKWLCKFE